MLRQKLAQILLYFIAWKFRGHFNFAIFGGKIAFRGIFISRFRQIDEFHGILISWSKQKMKMVNDLYVWKMCVFTYGENKLRPF